MTRHIPLGICSHFSLRGWYRNRKDQICTNRFDRSNNSEPVVRGRKLVLNYTDGSPCPAPKGASEEAPLRYKSTLISLLCDRDPLLSKPAISFVGAIDDCFYSFEVRTGAACAGVEATHSENVQLGGVFVGIGIVAVAVYLIGGCVYQRTVMHQRGWRQLPNYALWSGVYSFIRVSLESIRQLFILT